MSWDDFTKAGGPFWTLTLLLAFAAACSSSPSRKAMPDINNQIVVKQVDDLPHGWAGMTERRRKTPSQISIRRKMPEIRKYRVVAHELLHAVGLSTAQHLSDKDCYFHGSAYDVLPRRPCGQELQLLKHINRTFTVRAEAEVHREVDWAIGMWNHYLQRKLFVRAGW